ncbi:hypothetical protein ACHAXH_006601, partial [Discostella pseudostelligera]
MAKSIRSKSKRKNRTEFRNTIGSDATKATMAIVQEKIQQCVSSGQMNSFDRLSNLFAGNENNNTAPTDADGAVEDEDDDVDMMSNRARNKSSSVGKDESKIPTKKSKSKGSKHITGQYGDKTAKK